MPFDPKPEDDDDVTATEPVNLDEPAPASAPRTSPSVTKFVHYTGAREEHASMRRIKPDAWAQVGVQTQRTDIWHLGNDWRIPASQFTDAQLGYLLDIDGRFELVDADGKIVGR